MARNINLEWLREGTYLILTRPRSLGEIPSVIAYSMSYGKVWRYWMFNPDGLPNEDWILAVRENGYTKLIKKPIPPDRVKAYQRKKQESA